MLITLQNIGVVQIAVLIVTGRLLSDACPIDCSHALEKTFQLTSPDSTLQMGSVKENVDPPPQYSWARASAFAP